VAEGLNEFAPSPGFGGDDDDDKYTPQNFGKPFNANYLGKNKFEVFCQPPGNRDPSKVIKLNAEVQKYGLEWDDDFGFWFLDSPGSVYLSWKYGEIPLPKAIDQARNPGHIHDLVTDYLTNSPHAAEIQKIATEYFGFTPDGEMNEGVAEGERTMSRAAKGNEKYGKDGMRALAKAGREGASEKKLDAIRDKHDNYNEEAKHGLYYNVNKRKAAGTSRPASSPKAPTAQAWKDAAKTAKKESIAESEGRCMQCGMKDCKCPGTSCKCKPIAGWVPGKGFKKAMDEAANAAQQAAIAIAKKKKQGVEEEWSKKYKSSINCSHPKGFSQKAHCAGKKKHNESMMTMEAVCPDCGMCQTHGNISEIKKGAKDSNGVSSCWSGYHAAGTKKGRNGGQVRNCVPNEGIAENPDWYNDEANSMSSSQLKSLYKHAMKLRQAVKQMQAQGDTLEPWQQSKVTKAADYLDAVFNAVDDDHDMGEQTELESVGIPSYGVGGYRNRGDDERHDLDDPELQRNRQEVTYYNITIDGKPLNPKPIFGRNATIAWGKKHAATGVDLSNAMISPVKYTEDAYMESLQNMLERSVSQAQHNLMVGVAHNPAFAQKVKVKRAVGQEFANADQGHDISKLPIRVPKKK
jgi:hypothetical protein